MLMGNWLVPEEGSSTATHDSAEHSVKSRQRSDQQCWEDLELSLRVCCRGG
jgi:hypothetical protein